MRANGFLGIAVFAGLTLAGATAWSYGAPRRAPAGAELSSGDVVTAVHPHPSLAANAAPAAEVGPAAVHDVFASPPASWDQGDPADSLYRAARDALGHSQFASAAALFARIPAEFPRSTYAPDALYWQAFALYRGGNASDLQAALAALDAQRSRYPQAATRGDAEALATRVRGELARRGDAEAAERVARDASRAAEAAARAAGGSTAQSGCPADSDQDDVRTAALNALLQMDADRAVPLLKQVLARRDACSAPLRRRAVFLLSQKRTSETESLLTRIAREDPDPEVRNQAIFWLSQVPTDAAVSALQEVLRTSSDPDAQARAIFALAQHSGARAMQILRDYAESDSASDRLRERAIFWIGQKQGPESSQYLRTLFGRAESEHMKEQILFAISQRSGADDERFLLDVATNGAQPLEVRKKAIFLAAQQHDSAAGVIALYDRLTEPELKEQALFALSQRNEPAAVDKLIDVARNGSTPGLRKKAIFWLSQSHDPRVVKVLQELINR